MSLSSIPADIRIKIWILLLTRPCPVNILFESERAHNALRDSCRPWSLDTNDIRCQYLECLQYMRDPATGPSTIRGWRCVGPKFSTGVLLTCRSIYEEAVRVFYEGNKFILSISNTASFPVFDFSRIRSLHIDTQNSKRESSLPNYKEIMEKIKLDPGARLTITTSFEERDDSLNFISAVQSLGPVKQCTLSLTWATGAASLAAHLMKGQEESPEFGLYNKLPEELRYHILSYTDLVQDYYVLRGRVSLKNGINFKNDCCRSCCETLFGCCCPRPPRKPSLSRHQSNVIGSRFSETCRCKPDPLPLLQISPEVQSDALRVLFAKSRFEFVGHTFETLNFLHKIERHLKLLREIVLDINYADLHDWEQGIFSWDAFIGYIQAHFSLSQLSLKITARYTVWGNETVLSSKVEHLRSFYESLIPGLQRLTAKGLTRFSIQFRQKELKDWENTYKQQVLGTEDMYDNE